jgi:hypothetical protein
LTNRVLGQIEIRAYGRVIHIFDGPFLNLRECGLCGVEGSIILNRPVRLAVLPLLANHEQCSNSPAGQKPDGNATA